IGVIVALEQLADLPDAGVLEHRGVDAGGNFLRLDVVPGRGMVHHLQHDVDVVAHIHGGDLTAGDVGDGVAHHIDTVGGGGGGGVVVVRLAAGTAAGIAGSCLLGQHRHAQGGHQGQQGD